MHAMEPNVAGVIGSAVAAGILLAMVCEGGFITLRTFILSPLNGDGALLMAALQTDAPFPFSVDMPV